MKFDGFDDLVDNFGCFEGSFCPFCLFGPRTAAPSLLPPPLGEGADTNDEDGDREPSLVRALPLLWRAGNRKVVGIMSASQAEREDKPSLEHGYLGPIFDVRARAHPRVARGFDLAQKPFRLIHLPECRSFVVCRSI